MKNAEWKASLVTEHIRITKVIGFITEVVLYMDSVWKSLVFKQYNCIKYSSTLDMEWRLTENRKKIIISPQPKSI